MPSLMAKSLPTIVTFDIASGPLPMRVKFLMGAVLRPSSTSHATVGTNTKSPLEMSTCPPLKDSQYTPCLTVPRISSGSDSPLARKVVVMRGIG